MGNQEAHRGGRLQVKNFYIVDIQGEWIIWSILFGAYELLIHIYLP